MGLDSGHWYTQEGEPSHFRIAANGNERPTTLRDARKENLVPSVTTVLKVLSRPNLERWKRDQDILAAEQMPRLPDEDDRTYIARVQDASMEQVEQAADLGSAIHAGVEEAMRGNAYPPELNPYVEAATREVESLFPGVNDWVVEQTFAHPWGYGGMVDLHSPSMGFTVDYKSKDGDLTKKLAYDQNIQLASYQKGLHLPPAPAASVFISRTHPGVVASHLWDEESLNEGWEKFKLCLALWKLEKNYDPSSELVA